MVLCSHRIRYHTEESMVTDENGRATVRGFKGTYDVTVIYGSTEKSFEVQLLEDGTTITLNIDTPSKQPTTKPVNVEEELNNLSDLSSLNLGGEDTTTTSTTTVQDDVTTSTEATSTAITGTYTIPDLSGLTIPAVTSIEETNTVPDDNQHRSNI